MGTRLRLACAAILGSALLAMPLWAASANANDVSLALSFSGGVDTFYPGDTIRLQMVFTANQDGLSLNSSSYSRPSPIDTVVLTPATGAFNWLEDQEQGHGYSPDYSALTDLKAGKPITITLTLNDTYRFDTPGHYSVHVISRRLSTWTQNNLRVLPPLTSNEIGFDIVPADPQAEAFKAEDLERQIRAAPDLNSARALARQLDYLPGDSATEAKLSLFINPKTFYPFSVSVMDGLWIATNRELVVGRLEQSLADPTQTSSVTLNKFETIVALASSLHPSTDGSFSKDRLVRDGGFYVSTDIQTRLCHLVATTLPQRTGKSRINAAQTIFMTLIQSKQTNSPDFQSARNILINHFDEVDPFEIDWLVRTSGDYLEDPRIVPALMTILDPRNCTFFSDDRAAALKLLSGLNPEGSSHYVVQEACSKSPAYFPQLPKMRVTTLPGVDDCLLQKLEVETSTTATRNEKGALDNTMRYLARFATAAPLKEVREAYISGGKQWHGTARGAALAYLMRWDPTGSVPLLQAAFASEPPNSSTLLISLEENANEPTDGLRSFLRNNISQAPNDSTASCVYVLSRVAIPEDQGFPARPTPTSANPNGFRIRHTER